MNIDPRLAESLFQAVHDAHKLGMWQDTIFNNGLRSKEVQADIYNRSFVDAMGRRQKTQQWAAAPPGRSNHQFGLAADMAAGPIRSHVRANLGTYGLETVPNDPPHVQLAGSVGLRRNLPMATNASMGQPSPRSIVGYSRPSPTPQPALAGLDPTQPTLMSAVENARLPSPGTGVPIDAARRQVTGLPSAVSPNMNMGGYGYGPMASVGGVPRAPLASQGPGLLASPNINLNRPQAPTPNMNMAGYQSPMTGLTGMPEQPSRQTYGPPTTRSRSPAPEGQFEAFGAPEPVDQQQLRNPSSGMSFNPSLPTKPAGGMSFTPELPRDPSSGMSFTPGLPRNPQSGMSFTPGLPRNPQSGMSFNPSLPRNPIGGMSFNPSLPRNPMSGMSFNPSPPRNPIGGMSFTPGLPGQMPQDGVATAEPQDDPMDPITDPQPSPPQQGGGFFAGLGETVKNAVQAPVDKAVEIGKLAWENINHPLLPLLTPPSKETLAERARHQATKGDGSDRMMWTGNEPPEQVAAMQQEVEEVLRGYFVQIPGQQYPQYTTGPA